MLKKNATKIWRKIDKPFFYIITFLVITGLFVFISGALSVLTKNPAVFYRMLITHIGLGLIGGSILSILILHVPYLWLKKYALPIFIATLVFTLLVFIPGLGFSHGGATRWISIGPLSLQPAEFLKIGVVLYAAAWYAKYYDQIDDYKFGLLPIFAILGVAGITLMAQPDTGTFLVIIASALIVYFVAGAPWKHIGIMFLIGCAGVALLLAVRPYTLARVKTYLNPSIDPHGSSYQIRQAFIALGSGGTFGRGYGQSVQKFNYLPEPAGDAVYAVVGEELGFIGSTYIIFLYLLCALFGLRIARRVVDPFGRLFVVGLVSILISQSFLNIGAIIGVLPLTGLPLVFMSHGGTSLLVALVISSLILNISQHIPSPKRRR